MASGQWKLPDLTGRTMVVTGASSGLGAVTARELAQAGAHVVLAVRDVAKGERVAAGISGKTEVRPLDVLVNNAGIMAVPPGKTADGFEDHFGTNHLGPFALTNLLLPNITDRVVTVSSGLARIGTVQLDELKRVTADSGGAPSSGLPVHRAARSRVRRVADAVRGGRRPAWELVRGPHRPFRRAAEARTQAKCRQRYRTREAAVGRLGATHRRQLARVRDGTGASGHLALTYW
ncbi:SDR family NAD(P)-dependent oxidoreductase [Amycolatopsis sp. NBC_00345]|uniref:SDR family NAD(P)-dependent oxidoreductase n=1 Tax=Amycolatopsis sp. NBC_00345 TaxID=2975955 RepID=UPI002E275EAF